MQLLYELTSNVVAVNQEVLVYLYYTLQAYTLMAFLNCMK